jgi:hypothetical protein
MSLLTVEELDGLHAATTDYWLKHIAIQLAAINESIAAFVFMNTYIEDNETPEETPQDNDVSVH